VPRVSAAGVVAVDTTGAGDALVTTFAAHVAAGTADEDAVHAAQEVAIRVR
jgi:sugar/nucleoside kinase (ribokinase family)